MDSKMSIVMLLGFSEAIALIILIILIRSRRTPEPLEDRIFLGALAYDRWKTAIEVREEVSARLKRRIEVFHAHIVLDRLEKHGYIERRSRITISLMKTSKVPEFKRKWNTQPWEMGLPDLSQVKQPPVRYRSTR